MRRSAVKRILVLASLFLSLPSAHALNICTMTFNSADEKGVFQNVYSGSTNHFFELVPNNKDPEWFNEVCATGPTCDILLISGHFGGLFFGQTNTQILNLSDMEAHACARDCGRILNAKQVYLMGCNTLATKTPDQRSIDQYLHVLVNDGFPQSAAEDVAASRYENFGLSLGERMSLAFSQAQTLYGFSSTSPLGPDNAPRLKRAFANQGANLDSSLANAFSGTSFRIVHPAAVIPLPVQTLSCELRSPIAATRTQGFLNAFSSPSLPLYFDQILNQAQDESLLAAIATHPASLAAVATFDDSILAQTGALIGTSVKAMRVEVDLGKMSHADYLSKLGADFSARVNGGLDYVSLDQVCSIARQEPELLFDVNWLRESTADSLSYTLRLASCFPTLSADVLTEIKTIANTTTDPFSRREALRASKGQWSASEQATLLQTSAAWSNRDRIEVQHTLLIQVGSGNSNYETCAQNAGAALSPDARDNARWSCFNTSETAFATLPNCLAAASVFETESGLGARWYCMGRFPSSLTIAACVQAAENVVPVEKSDDFITSCFETLRSQKAINRSECLGFTEVLKIPGNQIKQNWNCVNELQD
jgi:hypothetical protein